jgi:hypothetical protein
MQYQVRFIGDEDLPGATWVIVPRTPDGLGPFLFIRESAVSAELLTQTWQAWQDYLSSSSLPAASNA